MATKPLRSTAVATAQRALFPSRAQLNYDPPFLLNLLVPAFVLSLMHRWAGLAAPQLGHYFTMEGIAFLYSYYVLARAVYVHHNARDSEGRFHEGRARKAEQEFYRLIRAMTDTLWKPVLLVIVPAVLTDVATAGRQFEAQKLAAGPINVVSFAVWFFVAPSFILACARWTQLQPFDLPSSRQLLRANRWIAPSFLTAVLVILAGGSLALGMLYPLLRAIVVILIPSGIAIALYSTVFFTCLITLAVWIQCVWSQGILDQVRAAKSASEAQGLNER